MIAKLTCSQRGSAVRENTGSVSALLDVRAVAAFLRCSPRHVTRLAEAGRIPQPVRLGMLVRWSRAVIERWIEEGCPACDRREGRL